MTTYRLTTAVLSLAMCVVAPGCDDESEEATPEPGACTDPGWTPGACVAGTTVEKPASTPRHVAEPDPILYTDNPPSSGAHRPVWARWGQFSYLAPEWFIHNLEHGGVAVLYDPCLDSASKTALKTLIDARPADDGGAFRYVMTPYPGLSSAVAVVAWEWSYTSECVNATEITEFIDEHYRMAPEDVPGDGAFIEGWIER